MSCSIRITLTRKCHLLFRVGTSSSRPMSNFGTRITTPMYNTIRINGSCPIRSSADDFRWFARPHVGFGHLGLRSLRVSSGGAGGGTGGSGYGSSGNGGGSSGGGGGGGGDGRESGWSFLAWYLSLLAKYPVMTKAATSSFLNLVGDVICQRVGQGQATSCRSLTHESIIIGNVEMTSTSFRSGSNGGSTLPIDSRSDSRTSNTFSYIAIASWFILLVVDKVPSLDLKRAFLFAFLGLVLVGPTLHFWYLFLSKLITAPGASGAFLRLLLDQFIFSPIFIGTFLAALVSLEGRPSLVIPKLQQEWFSSVLANWQLWIPFQFLNFRFVPQQFQVLAANFIALIWNVILSYKAHQEVAVK